MQQVAEVLARPEPKKSAGETRGVDDEHRDEDITMVWWNSWVC